MTKLLALLEDWKDVGEAFLVRGRIESLTAEWKLIRQGQPYEADEVRGFVKLLPENLRCDLVIVKPIPAIEEDGSTLPVIGEVIRRLSRTLDLAITDVMVQHMQTLYKVVDDKPTKIKTVEVL